MTEAWTRLLRSTPFRLALTFAFLFMLAFVLAGAIVYQMMSADLAEQLDDTIKETYAVIASAYADNDPKELVEIVESHATRSPKKEQLFSLTDAAGTRLAGNFTAAGLPDGFSMFGAEMPGMPPDTEY
ncbi:MAG: two-component sensor histidine kinase, partial [Mesorhizobium sp.]